MFKNGQYSLILNPETIKLVAERKASVLKLIEDKIRKANLEVIGTLK